MYNLIVANIGTNELVNEYMSDESDEEMVMQDWRRNRFLRQTYLDSIRVICNNLPAGVIIHARIVECK